MHSLVARQAQAPSYHNRPALACAYYSYWSGVPVEGFEIHLRTHRVPWLMPTHDGLTMIGVGWPHDEFAAYRADIEGNYLRTIELAPNLAERVREGKREERFMGTADLPNFFRRPYGPGWALVGDAGYHKDPSTAQGISDAFRDAELCTAALADVFEGRRSFDDAMAGYQRRRDRHVLPMYEFTTQLATLEGPPPEMQQLLGAVHRNSAAMNAFVSVIAGTMSPLEFFAPDHIGAIMATGQERAVA
jgi:flavin-dependent dehydrogenase